MLRTKLFAIGASLFLSFPPLALALPIAAAEKPPADTSPPVAVPDKQPDVVTNDGGQISKKELKHAKKEEKSKEKLEEKQPDTVAAQQNMAPCISWTNPAVKPRVVLFCIHGLGLYSGSYKDFGTIMAKTGVAVFAIDVRGFGSWMKSGGNQPVDFNDCLRDIHNSLTSIKSAYPDLPVFLLGESMGGAIALRFASLHPDLIDGLVSSVPSGDRFKQKKIDLKVALEMFKGPSKEFDIGKDVVKQATTNDKMRSDWAGNPLDRMDLSPKDLIHFQEFMNDNHDAAKLIEKLPVLFVEGNQDKLVKPEGTWELFTELTTPNKVFLALPSEHLVFEETQDDTSDQKLRNFRMLGAWLFTQAKIDGKLAAPATNDNGMLAGAITKLVAGQPKVALGMLQKLAVLEPTNGEVHYWEAQAYLKTQQPALAKQEFAKSMALGRGTQIASQANDSLVQLHNDAKTAATAADPSIPPAPDLTDGKPTVLTFFATWCEQCNHMDAWIDHAKTAYGDKVKITKVDVDDPANKALVGQYKVGPIPTTVFLRRDGTLSSTVIGATTFDVMATSITAAMH